ncbi:TIGR03943 family putative permease subunit [Streptomyces sp. NBC_00503]|uniref:TIGR03943 family putative permease subunit n=1 Tax=Streptomyces sp. NBC_00503 TaxID=2903659 RepID=UPI002E7FF17F|nr:TIGR03943 family protein [Streptomyces sp. NBC_00503]WUD79830.1 TIGR03943 family protein [Streptomyces sp. NBC_00503]
MKRSAQAFLLLLIGSGLLHVSLFTDLCLRYVKPGMRPVLIASGVLLLVLATADVWPRIGPNARRGATKTHEHAADDGDEPDDVAQPAHGHGHDHSGVPRVAWLLFLPALSLLVYAPPALGSYTASRETAKVVVTEQQTFEALPATSPLPMTLTQFTRRVQQDSTQAISGRTVRMSGLVTLGQGHDGWYLTRILISCCAADAQSVKVRIHGAPSLPADTWVSVTGTWHPGGTLGTQSAPAELDASTVEKIDRPVNGYSDSLPIAPSR